MNKHTAVMESKVIQEKADQAWQEVLAAVRAYVEAQQWMFTVEGLENYEKNKKEGDLLAHILGGHLEEYAANLAHNIVLATAVSGTSTEIVWGPYEAPKSPQEEA